MTHSRLILQGQRSAASLGILLALCALSAEALAVGRVQWKQTKVQESGESWRIEVAIYLDRAPDVAFLPMRFSFVPSVYYERSLVDGNTEPVLRKVPLVNRQPIVESVDIGFLDAGRGEIQSRTRFSFKITREHGFEAGEYEVTLTNSRSNATVGQRTRIILEGDNPTIDRRAVVFSGEKKKPKPEEKKAEDFKTEEEKSQLSPEDDAYWAGGSTNSEKPDSARYGEVKEKPGGGCRMSALPAQGGGLWLGLALLLPLLRRRHA